MKIAKGIVYLIIALWLLAVLLSLFSCNPVKKVLNDPEKFNVVKEEVLRRGYCANDTTIITKSDTLVTIDTVNNYYIDTETINDTVYKTRIENKIVTKKITIRDTVRSVVVDNAHIKLLQADLDKISAELIQYKEKAKSRLKWLLLLFTAIGLYIWFKIRR